MGTNRLSWQFSSNKADQKENGAPFLGPTHIWPNTEKVLFHYLLCLELTAPKCRSKERKEWNSGIPKRDCEMCVKFWNKTVCAWREIGKNNTCDVSNTDLYQMVSGCKRAEAADFNNAKTRQPEFETDIRHYWKSGQSSLLNSLQNQDLRGFDYELLVTQRKNVFVIILILTVSGKT